MEPKKTDLTAALEAATVRDDAGRVRGYNVITANGDLVLARPDSLRVEAIVGQGEVLAGLKPGFRLATADDLAKKAAAAKAALAKGKSAA